MAVADICVDLETIPYKLSSEANMEAALNTLEACGGETLGLGNSIHYCAAKHGFIGLTKGLAMEVSASGINVNAVYPGTVETAIIEGLVSQIELESDAYDHYPQGHRFKDRKITAEDIAYAVCWLLSEESRSITGSVINVDAGRSARG